MKFEFVCHASLTLETGSVRLLSDPWLTGTAFDNGWALLSEPTIGPDYFRSITHLWYSHEHPDHFSPATIAMIPEEVRSDITVLFHRSDDQKVLDYCRKKGLTSQIEIADGNTVDISDDVRVTCGRHGQDDSWLLVDDGDLRVLNLNDCQVNTLEEAKRLHAQIGDVDVLLTQFSISSWDGNPEDLERRMAGAMEMLKRTVMQAQVFRPRYVVPFASYIWFCHEENRHMNQALIPVGRLVEMLDAETSAETVVMYPGDEWEPGAPLPTAEAVRRYEADLEALAQRPRFSAEPVPIDTLVAAADRFTRALTADVSSTRYWLREKKMNLRHQLMRQPANSVSGVMALLQTAVQPRIRGARIWLTDHNRSLEFCITRGMRPSHYTAEECDIELSSAALNYSLRFLWGGESLQINGRFREVYAEGRRPLFEYLWIACAMNREDGAQARPL